ncbi:MAG: gamma-glutamyl-gamma-aminobutyrate hydrolase family protein [Coriobacteriia bacterium]|nr:gamma-glutamyl-gamma-aminobutyrate hydrolase family protein [Coriobacteriia bacterium]MBS5477464.1 gamma-glutamyl-gamma-aminobutyrate hydrolase family protein [Coriobacteriia bacterium]
MSHPTCSNVSRAPLIGICPRTEERSKRNGQAILAQKLLVDGIKAAGGVPVVLSETTDPAELARYVAAFDGFVVPGGGDIEPACYGAERLPECGPAEEGRDDFELALVPLVVEADKPLFGICRGNQLLNVALGGTLWQDIPSQLGTLPTPDGEDEDLSAGRAVEQFRATGRISHDQGRPFDTLVHDVAVQPGTLLANILEDAPAQAVATPLAAQAPEPTLDLAHVMVNSLHHQSVRDAGPDLVVNAMAPDGVIEGVELPGKRFVLAVQWHPEMLWPFDGPSMRLFEAFVAACSATGA